jgi:hypothetical protein
MNTACIRTQEQDVAGSGDMDSVSIVKHEALEQGVSSGNFKFILSEIRRVSLSKLYCTDERRKNGYWWIVGVGAAEIKE